MWIGRRIFLVGSEEQLEWNLDWNSNIMIETLI